MPEVAWEPWLAGWAAALLGVVLLWAGAAKVGGPAALQRTLADLGLPAWLGVRPLTVALPLIEIVVGAMMLAAPPAAFPITAVCCLVLMAAFAGLALLGTARGGRASCACFGQAETPLGWRALVRNVLLTLLAVLALSGRGAASIAGPPDPVAWTSVAVLVLVGLAMGLGRRALDGRTPRRARRAGIGRDSALIGPSAEALQVEAPMPTLATADGVRVPWETLTEAPTHLVFFSASCDQCAALVERFRWYPHAVRDGHDVVPVLIGSRERYDGIPQYAPLTQHALFDLDGRVARALGKRGTPGVVTVDPEHPRGDGWTAGASGIEAAIIRDDFFHEFAGTRR